jgi:hypothetical protein
MAQLTSCVLPSKTSPFAHPASGATATVQRDLLTANCGSHSCLRRVRLNQNATDSSCQRMQRRQQFTVQVTVHACLQRIGLVVT